MIKKSDPLPTCTKGSETGTRLFARRRNFAYSAEETRCEYRWIQISEHGKGTKANKKSRRHRTCKTGRNPCSGCACRQAPPTPGAPDVGPGFDFHSHLEATISGEPLRYLFACCWVAAMWHHRL